MERRCRKGVKNWGLDIGDTVMNTGWFWKPKLGFSKHTHKRTHAQCTYACRRRRPASVWWLLHSCACHLAITLMAWFLSWATGGHTVNIMSQRDCDRNWGDWGGGGFKGKKWTKLQRKAICVCCQWRVLKPAAIGSNISVLAPDVYSSPPLQLNSPPLPPSYHSSYSSFLTCFFWPSSARKGIHTLNAWACLCVS